MGNGQAAYNIQALSIVALALFLLIPALIFRHLKLGLSRKMFIAVFRTGLQLGFVGLYLQYIFDLDNLFVNLAYVFVMALIAGWSALSGSALKKGAFWGTTVGAIVLTLAAVYCMLFTVFSPQQLFLARYFIPLSGMLLGNVMRANIIALQRFYDELKRNNCDYIHYTLLGGNTSEAVTPFLRQAYRAAVTPQLETMATMGLVSLPGMMTGQILGGSSPVTAIHYQVMIMIAIYLSLTISAYLSLRFSLKRAFDHYGRLRPDIFAK